MARVVVGEACRAIGNGRSRLAAVRRQAAATARRHTRRSAVRRFGTHTERLPFDGSAAPARTLSVGGARRVAEVVVADADSASRADAHTRLTAARRRGARRPDGIARVADARVGVRATICGWLRTSVIPRARAIDTRAADAHAVSFAVRVRGTPVCRWPRASKCADTHHHNPDYDESLNNHVTSPSNPWTGEAPACRTQSTGVCAA